MMEYVESNWIDELSRKRLQHEIAGALFQQRFGIGEHMGLMEHIHREDALSDAKAVLSVLDNYFERTQNV